MQVFGDDDIGHGEKSRRIRRWTNEDMLVRECLAGPMAPWVDADDAHAVLLGVLQVLHRPGSERAVARRPAPHDDQLRIDVIGWLAPRRLVADFISKGRPDGKDLGFGGHVRPHLRAATEQIQKPQRGIAIVQDRGVAGP